MKHSRFGLSGISFGIAAYGHGQYTESAGNERRGSAGSSEEGERDGEGTSTTAGVFASAMICVGCSCLSCTQSPDLERCGPSSLQQCR